MSSPSLITLTQHPDRQELKNKASEIRAFKCLSFPSFPFLGKWKAGSKHKATAERLGLEVYVHLR